MKKKDLTPQERKALRAFVTYLQDTISDQLEAVALFGSKVRGDSHSHSDIDVLVILACEDRALRRTILKRAARISLEHDVLLSPRVIGLERWKQLRGFSLYRNITKESAGLDVVGGDLALETTESTFRAVA
jgi:predicted nucleotidyltransferase